MIALRRRMLSLALVLAVPGSLLAQAPAPAAAKADPIAVLKAIPADASGFVAIPSLQKLDENVNGIAQQLQLVGLIPSPLEYLKSSTGLTTGLNERAGVAFVILNLGDTKTPEAIADKLVILLPATNADALIKALGGTEKEGDFTRVTLMGQPSLAAARGDYVVAAEKADTLKAYMSAQGGSIDRTLSPDRLKAFEESDLFAWANPSTVSKELQGALQDGLKDLMNQLNAMGGRGASDNGQAEQIAVLVEQTDEIALSLSVNPKNGLVISYFTKARAGTDLAKQMATVRPARGSLLNGLPSDQILVAVGGAGAAGDATALMHLDQAFSQAIEVWAELLESGGVKIEKAQLEPLKSSVVKLIGNLDRFGLSISGLPIEGNEGRLGLVLNAKVRNSREWLAEARKLFEQGKELAIQAAKGEGVAEDKIQAVVASVAWKEGAETVDGVAVDHFVIDLDKLAAEEAAQQELEMVKSFIGREGVLFRLAAVDQNTVVITFGGGKKRFTDVVALAKQDDAPLAKSTEIQKVAKRLPQDGRVLEAYVSIENLLNLISSTFAQMGTPLPFPLALRNAAPIAFTTNKVGETGQQSELLVPMELIVSVKEAVGPMLMMMGGGMEGPPPAGSLDDPNGELN